MSDSITGVVVRRAPSAVTELFGDEAVVWLEDAQTVHQLDASGGLIWRCLEQPGTADEVARRVAGLVDAPVDVVHRDVHDFLETMRERSLVVSD